MGTSDKASGLMQGTLTPRGRAALKRQTRDWEPQAAAIARILHANLGEL